MDTRPIRLLSASTNAYGAFLTSSSAGSRRPSNCRWLATANPIPPNTDPLCSAIASRSSTGSPRSARMRKIIVLPTPVMPCSTMSLGTSSGAIASKCSTTWRRYARYPPCNRQASTPSKSITVATVLLRIPPRQQKTTGILPAAAVFMRSIKTGNFAEAIASPNACAACGLSCLYTVPILARSSSLNRGTLTACGMVDSPCSDSERTSIHATSCLCLASSYVTSTNIPA